MTTDRPSLRPEVKAKWVAALRSGDYKQGRNALRTHDDHFCCLGVLCDLAVKEGAVPVPTFESPYWRYDGISEVPPLAVWQWAYEEGITLSNPNYLIPDLVVQEEDDYETVDGLVARQTDELREIVVLNDEDGYTFSELADLIEEQL